MTRHELKEQLRHDHFTDVVSDAFGYTQEHRDQVIRWVIVAVILAALAGLAFWYNTYRRSVQQQDLQAAFTILEAPVAPPSPTPNSFPNEQAKRQASIQALSKVISKDGGSREGLIAQYYRGTLKAQSGDVKGAIADLETVAQSNKDSAPLAKIALAQLYAGQNRVADAQRLLRQVIDKPTDLVSRAQAQILLARLEETTNPKDAKRLLESMTKTPNQDPAVTRAAEAVSSQLAK